MDPSALETTIFVYTALPKPKAKRGNHPLHRGVFDRPSFHENRCLRGVAILSDNKHCGTRIHVLQICIYVPYSTAARHGQSSVPSKRRRELPAGAAFASFGVGWALLPNRRSWNLGQRIREQFAGSQSGRGSGEAGRHGTEKKKKKKHHVCVCVCVYWSALTPLTA